jgi:hypothetical protein
MNTDRKIKQHECHAASPNTPQLLSRGNSRNSRQHRRSGAVLIVVLVCFAVATVLFVLLARQAVAERHMAETRLWTLQAQWVAEAALERAAARLAAEPNYAGETWTIPAAEFVGTDGARATIQVETVADQPNRRLVRVEANYPDDPVHRAQFTKQVTIDRPAPVAPEGVEESEND